MQLPCSLRNLSACTPSKLTLTCTHLTESGMTGTVLEHSLHSITATELTAIQLMWQHAGAVSSEYGAKTARGAAILSSVACQ